MMALSILRNAGWVTEDRLKTRMNALAASFTKTNRILLGRRDIAVQIQESRQNHVPAPAFSDGQNVVINRDKFKDITSKVSLVRLLGANYHELSHIMFTPRQGTKLRTAINAEHLGLTFNTLEDQRIETLFTAMYEPAGKFFAEMVVEFMVENDQTWPMAHLLTHGRRFLPLEMRQEFSRRFAGSDDDKTRAEEIIDEFRLLNLGDGNNLHSSDITHILSLLREFHKIMNRAQQDAGLDDMPNPMGASEDGQEGCSGAGSNKGTPDASAQENASETAKDKTQEQDEAEEDGDDASGFWDDINDDDDDDNEEGEGDEEASGSGEDDEDDDDDLDSDLDSDDDSDEDGDEASGSAEGSGGSEDSDSDDDGENEDGEVDGENEKPGSASDDSLTESELSDFLKEILEGVQNSETVEGEVRQLTDAMNDPSALDVDDVRHPTDEVPAEGHVMQAVSAVEREFRRLHAELEPGWRYGSDQGRLNVQRAMSSEDYEDVFDEWDEGREQESGLEVVIAVDTSISMVGQQIVDACNAAWIIKRACDELDASVSVISFDAKTRTLFRRHDKVKKSVVPVFNDLGSNTCPAQSFRIARRILTQTDRPNKLFVIITDGDWSGANPDAFDPTRGFVIEDLRELIRTIPATTVFIGIGGGNAYEDAFDITREVRNATEIAPIVKTAISHMVGAVARRRR